MIIATNSHQQNAQGHSEHRNKFMLIFIGLSALFGSILNGYLTHRYHLLRAGSGATSSLCSISETFNCDTVAQSKYAEVLPGLPLSLIAASILFYIACLALWPLGTRAERRTRIKAIFLFATLGVLSGFPLLIAMHTQIQSYCLFCLITDLVCIEIAVLSFILLKRLTHATSHESKSAIVKILAGALIPALVAYVVLTPTPTDAQRRQKESANLIYEQIKSLPVETVDLNNALGAWGPASAKVQILMLGDFQCGACKTTFFLLKNLKIKYGDQLRWVLKEFPLSPACNPNIPSGSSGHPLSCDLAKGAICAEKQGKFFEYSERVYASQDSLTSNSYKETATNLGLDETKFSQCIQSEETALELTSQIDVGIAHKLQATPTVFINGRKSEGSLSLEVYTRLIEDALK